MGFQKGNKFSPGGKIGNKGGGRRPNKYTKEVREAGEEYARKWLIKRAVLLPVLKAYRQFAGGRRVKHRNAEGKVIYTEYEADAATTRHFMDKMVPAKQDIDVKLTGDVEIRTNVKPDMGPPPKRKK